MKINKKYFEVLMKEYKKIKNDIDKRLNEFKELWKKADDERIFAELSFCLLTPQSKAIICWNAIERLMKSRVLFEGNEEKILSFLKGVRFKDRKAFYIKKARDFFTEGGKIKIKDKLVSFENPLETREWLVKNIKGMGYKEASHFLRNIGFGEYIAILDRHILKNLKRLEIIKELPKTLTKKRYFEIEEKMREFSKHYKIPLDHLDLLLWYKETGKIFK